MYNCVCSIEDEGIPIIDYSETIKVAVQPLVCCECNSTINSGQRYEEIKASDEDGESWDQDTCLVCVAIWNDVFDGARLLGGFLAERLRDCNQLDLTTVPDELEWEEIDEEDAARVEVERRKREQ
jgi:hypothetical protein